VVAPTKGKRTRSAESDKFRLDARDLPQWDAMLSEKLGERAAAYLALTADERIRRIEQWVATEQQALEDRLRKSTVKLAALDRKKLRAQLQECLHELDAFEDHRETVREWLEEMLRTVDTRDPAAVEDVLSLARFYDEMTLPTVDLEPVLTVLRSFDERTWSGGYALAFVRRVEDWLRAGGKDASFIDALARGLHTKPGTVTRAIKSVRSQSRGNANDARRIVAEILGCDETTLRNRRKELPRALDRLFHGITDPEPVESRPTLAELLAESLSRRE
jgi:hypothetical protein